MLVLALLAPAAQATVVTNSSFETPVFAANSHNYKTISGTQWNHTGRSGIDNGNPFGGSNTAPYVGDQMAFLQGDAGWTDGVSSLGQDLSGLAVGVSYTLSFQAKGINAYSGPNPFSVSIDSADMFGLITPGNGAYTAYVSDSFIATSDTISLLFYDQGNVAGGHVSFIDDVQVQVYEPPLPNMVANGSFETPELDNPSHNYQDLSGTEWTHAGRSGIGRGNVFGGSGPNAGPAEGAQMAFLQGDVGNTSTPAPDVVTRLSQDVSGFVVGQDYTISFEAMAIDGYSGVNPFNVSMDGADLFGLISPGTTYEEHSTTFTATADTMTLMFYDQGNMAGGHVSWIDAVQISPVPEPTALSLLLAGVIAMFAVRARRR